MKPFKETLQTILGLVKTMHSTYYSGVAIEYPNKETVDPEHVDEFLMVEVSFDPVARTLPGNSSYEIKGTLYITHYRRESGGLHPFTDFTDTFFDEFSMQSKSGITFYEVKPYSKQGLPGFDGIMNVVTFSRDKFN